MAKAIADAIRVSPAEVRRAYETPEQLAPRSTLTGEPLPALMPSTALGWHAGDPTANTYGDPKFPARPAHRHRP